LVTLVGNLLDNAMEAVESSQRAEVTVTVRAQRRSCLVRVADTGPGLRPEDVADAFSRGWTTKGGGIKAGAGRGIGLSLVQEVVDRYAGTITVEADDNGTVFLVQLRSRRPEPIIGPPTPSSAYTIPSPVRRLSDAS
jgi:two-component system CitB family sensor kinase